LLSSVNFNIDSFGATKPPDTLKMGTELAPEMSENLHILTQLFAQENFIEHRHSSKMLKEAISFAAFIHSRWVLHKSAKESTQISPTYLPI